MNKVAVRLIGKETNLLEQQEEGVLTAEEHRKDKLRVRHVR